MRFTNGLSLTAFGLHVGVVLGQRSEEQMTRIDARRGIATMQHVETIRNRPICELPREPMSKHVPTINDKSAVPLLVALAGP